MLVDFRGSITDTSIDLITFTFNHFHFYLQHQSPLPETSSEGYFIWFVVSVYVCVQFHDFWHILLCFRQIQNVARFLRENTDFEQQKHQLLTESWYWWWWLWGWKWRRWWWFWGLAYTVWEEEAAYGATWRPATCPVLSSLSYSFSSSSSSS